MPEIPEIKREAYGGSKSLPLDSKAKRATKPPAAQRALVEINTTRTQIHKQLPKVSKNINNVKEFLLKKESPKKLSIKETKNVLKQLEDLGIECDVASHIIKAEQVKTNSKRSDFAKEMQKIKTMIDALQASPVMQIKMSEVTVFWQVINVLYNYIDNFERASVQPKRVRVEGVTNEKLDSH